MVERNAIAAHYTLIIFIKLFPINDYLAVSRRYVVARKRGSRLRQKIRSRNALYLFDVAVIDHKMPYFHIT